MSQPNLTPDERITLNVLRGQISMLEAMVKQGRQTFTAGELLAKIKIEIARLEAKAIIRGQTEAKAALRVRQAVGNEAKENEQ